MKIQNVTDASFRKYGKIITEYSFEKILKEMEHTPLPKDVVYVSCFVCFYGHFTNSKGHYRPNN